MSEQSSDGTAYCRNCSLDLSDPKNAGFLFEGDWYCSGMCAEVCSGFWSRGNDVADYNSQLAERTVNSDSQQEEGH